MDAIGVVGHIAFGIDEDVIDGAGRDLIDDFQTTDFHQPMSLRRAEPGGLGVEDNFTHRVPLFRLTCPRRNARSPAIERGSPQSRHWCRSPHALCAASRYRASAWRLCFRIAAKSCVLWRAHAPFAQFPT